MRKIFYWEDAALLVIFKKTETYFSGKERTDEGIADAETFAWEFIDFHGNRRGTLYFDNNEFSYHISLGGEVRWRKEIKNAFETVQALKRDKKTAENADKEIEVFFLSNKYKFSEIKGQSCSEHAVTSEFKNGERSIYLRDSLTASSLPLGGGGIRDDSDLIFCQKVGQKLVIVHNAERYGECGRAEVLNISFVDDKKIEAMRSNSLGFRAIKANKWEEARHFFERSLANDPKYPHANFNMACTLSQLKRPYAEATTHFSILLGDPNLAEIYKAKILNDTDLNFWRKQPGFKEFIAEIETKARDDFEKKKLLSEMNEKRARAYLYNNEGLQAYKKNDFFKARGHFSSAIDADPAFFVAYTNLASVEALLSKDRNDNPKYYTDSSIRNLNKAFAINPVLTLQKMKWDKDYDSIRNRPEFVEILNRKATKPQ